MNARCEALLSRVVVVLSTFVLALVQVLPVCAQPGHGLKIVDSHEVKVRGGVLQVDFAEGQLDEPQAILRHIQAAASAVTAYYGRFPVPRMRVLVVPVPGRRGVVQGTSWGDMAGFPGDDAASGWGAHDGRRPEG